MKGLILCGGKGTRLRPLTYTSAKQLIPVANKPILFYAIEAIRDAGIYELGIVVGETQPEVRRAVGDGSRCGVKVTYIEQEAPLGLAHAVKIARPFLQEEPFVLFLGDNIVREGITTFVERFKASKPDALILLSRVAEPQRFGVAELREGRIVRLVEKPKTPPSDLALVGVYLFNHHIFEAAEAIGPSWRNELEITDAIQYLIDKGYVVEPHMVAGWWKDTGKPEDVLEANRLMLAAIETRIAGEVDDSSNLTGQVVIEPGGRVVNSCIRGPAIIGEGSLIMNAYIGPFTSIGPNVTIVNSEVEHSVILTDSTVSDVPERIDDSLIGRNVVIKRSQAKPLAIKMVLGDNSRISVG
ncbi:MAG: glucose-1-phosphate thymidylyltransferase [Firmicutes bacterium]|nr:glucose-1-phosphate thymidylyltransferase [Bacillota bacterium]MCL5039875.1 glucose-1-phosphate thymidylyltransferase [Bacillota bacterium]